MEISIVIPVYNASAFLEKAVQSALQFDEVSEIILVEDASTDHSLEICRKLIEKDRRIVLLQHEDKKNHGAAETRNLGIRKATAEFIAFLDSDDYYLPNRFDAEKEIFKNKNTEGVFGALGIEYITEKGKAEFQEKFKNTSLTTVKYTAEGKEVFEGLLGLTSKTFGTFFHLNTLTVRRASILSKNIFFNKDLRVHQDSNFIIKLAYHCHLKTGIIDKAIAVRGVHDNNRITKIKQYSKQYNERQFLLWNSLYQWSKEKKINEKFRKRIFLQYKSFDLSRKSGLEKFTDLFLTILKTPEILKTRYRFTYLKDNQAQ